GETVLAGRPGSIRQRILQDGVRRALIGRPAVPASLLRRRLTLDQIAYALGQIRTIHHVEKSTASVLAALAVRPVERSLLIHIAKYRIRMPRRRDADLGMIPVLLGHAFQPDRVPAPGTRRRDVYCPRFRGQDG